MRGLLAPALLPCAASAPLACGAPFPNTPVVVPQVREGYVSLPDGARLPCRQVDTRGDALVVPHGGSYGDVRGVDPDLEPLGERQVLLSFDLRGVGPLDPTDRVTLTATPHVVDPEVAAHRRFRIDRMTQAVDPAGRPLHRGV